MSTGNKATPTSDSRTHAPQLPIVAVGAVVPGSASCDRTPGRAYGVGFPGPAVSVRKVVEQYRGGEHRCGPCVPPGRWRGGLAHLRAIILFGLSWAGLGTKFASWSAAEQQPASPRLAT